MKKSICPFLKKPCIEHDCVMYTQIQGNHPQTGEALNHLQCAIAMLPMLIIENSQQQRQTSAAVESFRNEMVKSNDKMLLLAGQRPGVLLDGVTKT